MTTADELDNNYQVPKTHPSDVYANQNQSDPDYQTEIVDLPSHGLTYQEDNPLSVGNVELKTMTTKEEDILTSENLIKKGVVIDKLLQSLIVTKINYNDLLLGDKNAIMVAARILAYGKDYPVNVTCPMCANLNNVTLDLTTFEDKEIDYTYLNRNNEYTFDLPASKHKITYKFLTHGDDKMVEQELKALKKIDTVSKDKENVDKELSTRLKYMITSIDGDRSSNKIRKFVDTMPARDALEFRRHLAKVTPNLDLMYDFECSFCDYTAKQRMPITVEFFWPNSEL